MSHPLFVGAYAASPCVTGWDPELESRFFTGLRQKEWIGGLEIPFFGNLHRFDDDWFFRNIDRRWNFVVTCIPGTMENLKKDPCAGLASDDEAGRISAIRFADQARATVHQLNSFLNRRAVVAVEIHSAPQLGPPQVSSSREAFTRSLQELRALDWDGANLLVEHCDRFVPGQVPAKGFLSIEDEISAIRASDARITKTPAGILVNWGRSAIEERDPLTPERHIEICRAAGVLKGLIFSGCSEKDPRYGDWADSHGPFQIEPQEVASLEANEYSFSTHSLMNRDRTRSCLKKAGGLASLSVVGLKIQALPKTLNLDERLHLIDTSGRFLARCQ